MTPDFTLIWPLSCLKDGVHLCEQGPPRVARPGAANLGAIIKPGDSLHSQPGQRLRRPPLRYGLRVTGLPVPAAAAVMALRADEAVERHDQHTTTTALWTRCVRPRGEQPDPFRSIHELPFDTPSRGNRHDLVWADRSARQSHLNTAHLHI